MVEGCNRYLRGMLEIWYVPYKGPIAGTGTTRTNRFKQYGHLDKAPYDRNWRCGSQETPSGYVRLCEDCAKRWGFVW